MPTIILKTKPNRMGNSKTCRVTFSGEMVSKVQLDPAGGSRGAALLIMVAPKEINDLVALAKRSGKFSYV